MYCEKNLEMQKLFGFIEELAVLFELALILILTQSPMLKCRFAFLCFCSIKFHMPSNASDFLVS